MGLYPFSVARVIDGDTFVADVQLRPGLVETVTVRLPCGDAPELHKDGGAEAKAALERALDGGLRLDTLWRKDKYGRILGTPYRDGVPVCAELLDAGWLR